MNKLVSVIIPCYNAELYIEAAVRSVMAQTYKKLEILVINDCSIDKTKQILLALQSEDPRIVYVENEENLKLVKTLNLGISLAKGEFVARMDADDISEPHRIQTQIDFMVKNIDYGVVGTFGVYIRENRKTDKFIKPVTDREIKRELFFDSPFIHPSVMFRKDIMIDYDENFYQIEDFALWVKLSNKTKFYNIPEVLIQYRILKESETRKSQADFVGRHQALKSVYQYLFRLKGYRFEDYELDQYTYSMFRHNFNKVNPCLLKKVYQQITKRNDDWCLQLRLSERWLATFFLADHTIKELLVYCLSKYTYLGLISLIIKRIKYVFH